MAPALQQENAPTSSAPPSRLDEKLHQILYKPEARAVLEECWRIQSYPYPAAIELAKLLEHQAKDLSAARRVVGDALSLLAIAAVSNGHWQVDLERRLQRLDRRVGVDERPELALTG